MIKKRRFNLAQIRALKCILEKPGCSQRHVIKTLEYSHTYTENVVNRLIARGEIASERIGNRLSLTCLVSPDLLVES